MLENPSSLKTEKTPGNPWLSWPMVALVLLGAGYYVGIKVMESQAANLHFIFHQTANGWEKVRTPAGYPDMLRITSGGTVWVRTWGSSALSRWDGKVWHYVTAAELPEKTSYKDNEFALDGEQVWAPTEQGVLHFDGQHWQSYKEAAASEGASIVAGGGEVWVIDHTGKLSHFAKGKWNSVKLSLPGVTWTQQPDEETPELARSPNGVVWLAWQGVWRLDGTAWSAVTGQTDKLDAEMIGAAGDRVWFSENGQLRSISIDGKHSHVYTAAQTGMEPPLVVTDLAASGGRTWFATYRGLVEFDGTKWRLLPLPNTQVSGFRRVAAGPAGELWVVGIPSREAFANYQRGIRVVLFVPVILLGLLIWIVWRSRHRKLVQRRLVTEAVRHATGEIPEELQRGEQTIKWGGWVTTLITLFGSLVGYALLRKIWPAAPTWSLGAIAVALHLSLVFLQSLTRRTPKPSDPIGPGAPSRYDWRKTLSAVAGTALLILILSADRFPTLHFLRGWTFWTLVAGTAVYSGLMVHLINAAIRRADYDGATNIVRWFHFYNPSSVQSLRIRGHILVAAGRYREAEEILRQSLASAQARDSYGSALEYLGDALMEQGRYDEAMRSYEAALHAFPWLRRPYRGMVEMLLRRGRQTGQALEWIEKIVDFKGLTLAQRKRNGHPQDDYWALKAWAQGILGQRQEAEASIENAIKATNQKTLPDLATTHYRAGMAMQALGSDAAARDYWKRAAELDPRGRRGALANAALRAQDASAVEQVRVG